MIGKVRVRVEKKKGPGSGNRNAAKYGLETRWPSIAAGEKTVRVSARVPESKHAELLMLPGEMSQKLRDAITMYLEDAKSKGLLDEEPK
jgi:hypothetical protein